MKVRASNRTDIIVVKLCSEKLCVGFSQFSPTSRLSWRLKCQVDRRYSTRSTKGYCAAGL